MLKSVKQAALVHINLHTVMHCPCTILVVSSLFVNIMMSDSVSAVCQLLRNNDGRLGYRVVTAITLFEGWVVAVTTMAVIEIIKALPAMSNARFFALLALLYCGNRRFAALLQPLEVRKSMRSPLGQALGVVDRLDDHALRLLAEYAWE